MTRTNRVLPTFRKVAPAMRYLLHRLFPDRLNLIGEKTLRVRGINHSIDIYLDGYGIPHIQADNEADTYFGLGYMHGRDRRFQIELFKFGAYGRIRELVGGGEFDAKLAEQDQFNRALGFAEDGRQVIKQATSLDREILDAYAAGINAATQSERMSMEFRLLGMKPEPWRAEDSATIIAWFSFGLRKNWELELGRLELLHYQLATGGTVERALRIWKPRYDLPPHLIDLLHANHSFERTPVIASELVEYLKEIASQRKTTPATVAGQVSSPSAYNTSLGSNVWAVGGRWTGTNKGALAADPHLPYSMPSAGYLAHIECELNSLRVIGAGFPGIPSILFGTNGKVAWGVAANWADVTDIYVEKPVDTDRYWAGREMLPFKIHNETFRIRTKEGALTDVVRTTRSTRHGPVLNDIVTRLGPDLPLVALRRDREMGAPFDALRALYVAPNTSEAGRALQGLHALVGHWVLSDTKGNVAYHSSVRLPKRTQHLGTMPVPGWTGTYEWEEMLSPAALPASENPAQDFVAAANNQTIRPESFAYPLNFEGDVPFRYIRLEERLGAGRDRTPIVEQMRLLQMDGCDLGCAAVLHLWREVLADLEHDPEPVIARAAQLVLSWNCDHRPDDPAPTIFHAVFAGMLRFALEDEMPICTLAFVCNYFNIEPFVFDVVANETNPVWEKRGGFAPACRSVFRKVVRDLEAEYGTKIDSWAWTRAAPFVLRHPFGSIEALASYVNRGPLPTSGSHNSLNKHYAAREQSIRFPILMGPVLRINVDMADLVASNMSLAGGQSGRPASRHYDDLLPLFLDGKGACMEMDMARIIPRAEGVLRLRPKHNRQDK
jgi:penicillin G amidase